MSEHDTLGILADEFVDRWRKGEFPTVAEYEEKHPALAHHIRAVFPLVVALEKIKDDRERPPPPKKGEPKELKKLGDFRIVRELGRGGMGVVYEAIQESLQRRVALKVLPKQLWQDDKGIRRFEREARMAANLHHTNIVPVFGFGEQDGHHYYVMQLIDGATLDRILAEPGRQKNLDMTRLALQAARALQYAHEHGVMHGDIKPSNFIVDHAGTLWIADFGLARAADHDSISHSGSLFGTLEYIAPERFQGQSDLRCDIYSLGLTLYEMFTGKVAFEDEDRSRLLKRVVAGDFPPPRTVRADIPRDLETIVLKACAVDPSDRYPTARALADDLECFVNGLPIRSRPASALYRFWKWCGRNPVVATLSGVAVALLVLVAVVATIGYVAQTRERRRVEATSATALEALDRIFDRFSARQSLGSVPQYLSKEDAELLQGLMTFYDRLAADDARKARAMLRVAHIHKWLGHHDEAVRAYREVIEKTELDALERARIHNEIGSTHLTAGRRKESREAHDRAAALLDPSNASHRYELARAYFLRSKRTIPGFGPNDDGPERPGPGPREDRTEALQFLAKAVKILEPMPSAPEQRFLLALCYREQTVDWLMHPDRASASGIEMLEDLVRDFPKVADYWYELAQTYLRFMLHHPDMTPELLQAAEAKLVKGLDQARQVFSDYPHIPEYQFALAHLYGRLAAIDERLDLRDRLERYLRLAIDVMSTLVDRFPEAPNYAFWLFRYRHQLGRYLFEAGRLEECGDVLKSAVASLDAWPDRTPVAHGMAYEGWSRLARVQELLGDAAAEEAKRRAEEHRQKMPARDR